MHGDQPAQAAIRWVGGPVLKAVGGGLFRVNESVLVGPHRLLGEVIHLDGPELTVQVFEDTTGLKPGDPVLGTGLPLAAPLGPGLLGRIFDGLLRPLQGLDSDFVRPGGRFERAGRYPFRPEVAVGDPLTGGLPFGAVPLHPPPVEPLRCLTPPEVNGRVTWIAPAGEYAEEEPLCTLIDAGGRQHTLSMLQHWPVRRPRPVAARLLPSKPLLTGQRILDTLFPVALGGKAAVPGGFGTGKTVLLEAIAKGCLADIIVYVGCGERGNEMAGVLTEFPELEDPRSGRPLLERMVVVANTSNMPVSAREASIYTGVTVAEYFRDMGLNVALMADSTSRWAEALREVSGRLGELPGEGGYPAYLSTRLAEFYERAASVRTLGCGRGSLTILGAVSPPSSDFSEPVTVHTKRYVKNFWALDRKRAQARFFPAIDPLRSYSEDADALAFWWHKRGNPRWAVQRRALLTLLEEQGKLERMARILGPDALPPRQRLTLLLADLVSEAFLRQSAFSPLDRSASPERQNAMLRVLEQCVQLAEEALARGVATEAIANLPLLRRVKRMGEEIGDDDLDRFALLEQELAETFHGLG